MNGVKCLTEGQQGSVATTHVIQMENGRREITTSGSMKDGLTCATRDYTKE